MPERDWKTRLTNIAAKGNGPVVVPREDLKAALERIYVLERQRVSTAESLRVYLGK